MKEIVIMDSDVCRLCPRECMVDRGKTQGFCRVGNEIKVARAALHYYEEPLICSENGSGAVFFSGCNLRCVFCQNTNISSGEVGKKISIDRLAEIFLELQDKGADNINLVTPTIFADSIAHAIEKSKREGLRLPIVYNSGGYEKVETLKRLEGLIDIYLPDFKYADNALGRDFSGVSDYREIALEAIAEMLRQCPENVTDERGLLKKGVIVRHLVLPGHTRNSIEALKLLWERFGSELYLSIMNQYTPMPDVARRDTELARKVTRREYEKVIDCALELGFVNGFVQEGGTQSDSFIPEFDLSGV